MDMIAWRATNDPSLQTDDRLREMLRYHTAAVVEAQRRYGHSTLRSDASMISEASDKASPWRHEARVRGITEE